MNRMVEEAGYDPQKIEFWGSKFLMGNGYLGYRGTVEEYGRAQLVACTMAGLYDKQGDNWREPVNAPNPFCIRASFEGMALDVRQKAPLSHRQRLDISRGLFSRETSYDTPSGAVAVSTERFASLHNKHLLALRYTVRPAQRGILAVAVSIDADIWDINGPHLRGVKLESGADHTVYTARTYELNEKIAVAQGVVYTQGTSEPVGNGRRISVDLEAGQSWELCVFAAVAKQSDEKGDCEVFAVAQLQKAMEDGFDFVSEQNRMAWQTVWERADVRIEGDDEADLALRHSLYLLLISTPFHTDRVAIPARGLSGQVYKGAMFWDTEIYMMPFFQYALPDVCRNLAMYRVRTLEGAREKARAYGYRGAFYAWESQETGQDSCTEYNVNDIFTGRPIRTYFRDKQIHISADVVYGLWQYVMASGDRLLLLAGGAEVILECARFLYSYSYYKPEKRRFELLDVTGADEYHERINNDAYTNYLAAYTLDVAVQVLELLETEHPETYRTLMDTLDYEADAESIKTMRRELYVPMPNRDGVVEQFDGYFGREDVTPAEVHARIIRENEYLGSPVGLAVETQVIKQADVVLVQALLRSRFTLEQKLANWRYYEPRTEHGSSLSTCIYALSAADCGMSDWAYDYFMKAAAIDLTGAYKLYVGDLYIGGVHSAANGGSWMVAIQGFAGLDCDTAGLTLRPCLPSRWTKLQFSTAYRGQRVSISVTPEQVTLSARMDNTHPVCCTVWDVRRAAVPGETVVIKQKQ